MKDILLNILADIWEGVKFWGSVLVIIAAVTIGVGFFTEHPPLVLGLFGIPATLALLWFTGMVVREEKNL